MITIMELENIKNEVEVHGEVAFIYIKRAGVEHIAVVDTIDLKRIDQNVKTKLTLDSAGFVQHKQKVDGKWEVYQLHRKIYDAFDWERISFKNGNRLDLRYDNLESDFL